MTELAFSPSLLAQDAANGVFLGAVFALLGIGVVLIYKSSGVLNFAHGSMAMFSTYVYYQVDRWFHLPVVVTLLVAVTFGGLLGAGVYLAIFRRMREAGLLAKVISALAVAGFLQGAAAFLWRNAKQVRPPQQFPQSVAHLGPVGLDWQHIGTIVVTVVVGAGVIALVKYTTFGVALRAIAQNRMSAKLLGVHEVRVAAQAWAVSGGLAALAGVLVIPTSALTVYSMSGYMVRGFVAAVVGGFVSLPAALIGGFGLGIAQESLLATPVESLSSVFAGLAVAALLLFRVERFFAVEQELRALEELD
jgi:branched-chain amino acid transport system permease protein